MSKSRHKAISGHPAGFTLFEVIVALALIIGLMGAVLVFYRQVTNVRNQVFDHTQATSAMRLVMDRITDELASAAAMDAGLFTGQADQIEFATTALPDLETPNRGPQSDSIIVGYRLRIGSDGQGQIVVDGLERSVRSAADATLPISSASTQPASDTTTDAATSPITSGSLFSPIVRYLSFRYWNGSTWQSNWASSPLPLAVEITLGEEPLPEGSTPETYPYDVRRRVVMLRSAASASATTAPSESFDFNDEEPLP